MSALLEIYSRRWNKELKCIWGVTGAISNVISQLELTQPALLPDMQLGRTLLLFSDYSGQHKQTKYEAFSFLLADLQFCRIWDKSRRDVRSRILRCHRRMSFKGMNDSRKKSALIPFLDAANTIPGLVVTMLVNKQYSEKFSLSHEERGQLPTALQCWPLQVIRKLMWVSHFGALFFAGLSAPGQNLLWFTDEDDIAANVERITTATAVTAGVISRYVSHNLGHFRFGTTACDNGDLFIEDLAAIPDLVAGALSETYQHGPLSSVLAMRLPHDISVKTKNILGWVVSEDEPLRRITLVIDPGDIEATVKVRALDLMSDVA